MTHNLYDFPVEKSERLFGAMKFESTFGDRMRAEFSTGRDELPHHMADLLLRLKDRPTRLPAASLAGTQQNYAAK